MHFGASMFFTDYAMSAPQLSIALEDRGFESVWASEHSHIPLSRKSQHPGGFELGKEYYDVMDPFVTLSVIAQATRTIKVGTGVLLVQQRDPIQTAKLVASLDQMSQGRFLFGIGGGWNQEEMENHGTVFATRFKRLRESIEAMKQIWTGKEAEYHGEFVKFDRMISGPAPFQKPHPPIHVGGGFPAAARRAIRYGDGWIPLGRAIRHGDGWRRLAAGEGIFEQITAFRTMAADAGRDPSSLEVTIFAVFDNVDLVKHYADMNVTRVIAMFPTAPADTLLPMMDHWQKIMREVNG
jgi:probable F420-dependent oxidoreductase